MMQSTLAWKDHTHGKEWTKETIYLINIKRKPKEFHFDLIESNLFISFPKGNLQFAFSSNDSDTKDGRLWFQNCKQSSIKVSNTFFCLQPEKHTGNNY